MSDQFDNPGSLSCADDTTELKVCLERSRREYLFMRGLALWAQQLQNHELAIRLFSAAANYAELIHSGFFVDPIAENALLSIGQSIDDQEVLDPIATVNTPAGRRSILHVLSEISSVGGLCRTLINWIDHDRETHHTVVVLRQKEPGAFSWFQSQLPGVKVQVIELDPDSGMLTRAVQLRQLARQGFSACVNHIGQAEAIASVAFATANCPPVLLVDHADHSFWLGLAMTDIVIHQRPVGAHLCEKRRGAKSCFVLPIPLAPTLEITAPDCDNGKPIIDGEPVVSARDLARTRFGIRHDQVMALSIGRSTKFRPMNQQNFFREAFRFARQHPESVLHVVGVEKSQAETWAGETAPDQQFVFHGEIPVDPQLRDAADVYLESYPFGSQTAFLEAIQSGLASVRASVDTPLLATSDTAVDDLIAAPDNEQQYWEQLSNLLTNPIERQQLADRLHDQVLAMHTGEVWLAWLQELYLQLEKTTHAPEKLNALSEDTPDFHDIALHRWHRWRGDEWADDHDLRLNAKSLINGVMSEQLRNSHWRLLPSLALRALLAGRADRTILKMGLRAALGNCLRS